MNLNDGIEGTASGTTASATYVTALTLELNPFKSTTILVGNDDDTSSLTYRIRVYAKMTGTRVVTYTPESTIAQGGDDEETNITTTKYAKAIIEVKNGDGAADYVIDYSQERLQRGRK